MIVTLMLNPNDCPLRHFTDVSDVQTLVSQAVGELAPSRTTKEYERCPNPDPCTVTLTDPVCGPLPLDIELSVTESTEADWETLPTRIPEVMTTRLELESELTVRQRTDVTDSHSVPSHPVELYRACWLYHVTHSNPPPCTVTLVDPVPALLVFLAVLTTPLSIDIMNISVPDPTRSPDVIDTRLVPRNDAWCRQRTDESDSHAVASHAVLRALAAREYLRDPSPAPCTVRLDDPVTARFNTPLIALTDP